MEGGERSFAALPRHLIFMAKFDGEVHLLLVADDDHDRTSWRAATPDAQTVVDMSEDRIPVRDAYAKGTLFRIDRAPDGTITIEEIDAIEPECLAQEGVYLHSEAEREWTALLRWSHDLKTLESILPESP